MINRAFSLSSAGTTYQGAVPVLVAPRQASYACMYIAHNFLQSVRLLADGMQRFETHCVRGVEAKRERIAELLERSLMPVTALAPHIGYDRAAEIAKRAHLDGSTLRAAALALGQVTAEDFDRWVKPAEMVHGNDGGPLS